MRGEIPPNLGCNDPANLYVTDALHPLNVTYTCDNVAFIIPCMEEQPTYLSYIKMLRCLPRSLCMICQKCIPFYYRASDNISAELTNIMK